MNPFALEVRQYVKALTAGLIAACSLLGGALGDGLSAQEWVGLVVAFLTGFTGVFYVENRDPKGQDNDHLSTMSGDAGHGENSLLVGLMVVVVVVLLVVLL